MLRAVVWLGLAVLVPQGARASMTLLVEQPYGHLNLFDPGGHSAVYLDRVCAASPTELRPCGVGEMGVVISRYDGVDGRDWLAMPLLPYLYSVERAGEIPVRMDRAQETELRDAYRRRWLESIAPDGADGAMPKGHWYELLGAAYDRTIYGFRVQTSAEQDALLIARLNDQRNVERYNGIYRNCADFVRVTMDMVYPGAERRNVFADVGVTSPKQLAKSLVKYARRHPEVGLSVFVIPQVPGSLPRSHSNTGVTEGVVKRYELPLVVISPELAGYALVAYVVDGRFEMPKHAPTLDLKKLEEDLSLVLPFPIPVPDLPAVGAPRVIESAGASAGVGVSELRVNPLQ